MPRRPSILERARSASAARKGVPVSDWMEKWEARGSGCQISAGALGYPWTAAATETYAGGVFTRVQFVR